MKYSIATMTMLGLLGSMITPAHAGNSSMENALARQGNLSMFYQALINSGVDDELNEYMDYTVFAPTNAAFSEIQPRTYPCFYAVQCRRELAAIVRNHIIPRNDSIHDLSMSDNELVATLGNRALRVEEPYQDRYTVDGYSVLYQNRGNTASIYPINGVIASKQELAQFRARPFGDYAGAVTEETVTTYSAPYVYPGVYGAYVTPGGTTPGQVFYRTYDDFSGDVTQTTTVTRTTTAE